MKKSIEWPILFAFMLICELAGILGSIFTIPAISGWYGTLQKPFFTPPDWAFGPVWLILYALMGAAAYLVWQQGLKDKKVKEALAWFGAQLVLNVAWSLAFFGLRSPLAGLVVILPLWATIAVTILKFKKIDRMAGWLMAPYLAWVSLALLLNVAIYLLN